MSNFQQYTVGYEIYADFITVTYLLIAIYILRQSSSVFAYLVITYS